MSITVFVPLLGGDALDVEAGQLGVPQQLEEGGVTALKVHAAEDHPRGRPDLLDQPGVVRGPLGVQD